MDYLVQFIVPRVQGSGLFHDDYSISRSLLDPPQTFGALVAISALLVGAVRVRYKLPVLSFGILWFFAGHLLESTFLPLEIYFEHRNYLPLIGLLFALAYCGFTAHLPFIRGARITLILFISLLTLITWQQARVWGHGQWLAEAWAQENPASVRAQQLSANFWVAQGKYEKARHRLRQVLEFHPNDLGLRLELIQIDCLAGKSLDRQHIEETIAWLPKGRFDNASTDTLRTLVEWHTTGRCPQLTVNDLHRLLDAILANARFQTSGISLSNLYYLQGQLYAAQGHLSPAVEALDKAFVHRPNVDVVLRQALWLASAGLYNDALQYIEKARQVDQRAHTLLRNTREEDIDALQQLISRAKNPASSDRPQ
jgi:tetratricopeptide (TPR) repeat protein